MSIKRVIAILVVVAFVGIPIISGEATIKTPSADNLGAFFGGIITFWLRVLKIVWIKIVTTL